MNDIKISDVIAPNFHELHKGLKEDLYTEIWLPGGRGSTKSSFFSAEIPLGMVRDIDANAVVFRKHDNELRDSVLAQIEWALNALGMDGVWRTQVSPMRAIYEPTGQMILFKSTDNPGKLKSIKLKRGYVKYAWFEECSQFSGMDEIRNILQSLFRGTEEKQIALYSFNPPKSARSWVNTEVKISKPGRIVVRSDYRTVPVKWLGERFIAEAEHLKKVNETAYRHEYLGEEVGTGLEVFNNVEIRTIPDSEIAWFDNFYQGLDFGYAVDPLWFGQAHYDATRRTLYIFSEISGIGISNRQLAEQMTEEQKLLLTIADSAEPKSIDELRMDHGLNITGAEKGAGSIESGVKWLQDLEKIVIDPERCPLAGKEFVNYALEVKRDGEVISKYPDKDNHSIDGVRYLASLMIKSARLQKLQKPVKIVNMPIASRW